ncbi:MAG: [protein-PII] uridylyltransferase [Acidiferrobacterales bacterium]
MPVHKSDIFDARRFDVELGALAAIGPMSKRASPGTLALFRSTLRSGRVELKKKYLNGEPVQDVITFHAWLVDQLLIRVWNLHQPLADDCCALALAAVGGYGRGELYPASDVDLLILLESSRHKKAHEFVQMVVQFLWDMGLEVGHSTRTLKDCVRESKKDITVTTNLMEARLLAGDSALFEEMRSRTAAPKIWPSKKFFAAKWQEQVERHHHFDDTAYNLEPNIKEGPGGLRDIQMIAWVTQRQFGSAALHDLVALEFLSEAEYRALTRGRHLLSQLRCGIHYLADHREDRLLFDYQRALASQMGYVDNTDSLAVEQFMKHYYRTVKELALLNEILLQHFQEAILSHGKARVQRINRRFQARDAFLEITRRNIFERSPFAMLEMFLVLQQNPELKGVRAQTIRLLRENLSRIDDKFRADIACRSLFMEILRQPQGITHALRRMNAYRVLGAYIPAFGRIVGQMQHDLFHVYTVDEHTLFVVRNLRRFTVSEFRHEFPFASHLMQHVVKPERLYLAGLFHDIAKGRGGDHSTLGEADARAFCELHGLSEYDTRFVCWLVRNHLVMSWTAQRQDIMDPGVVMEFAQKVGDQEHLDNLYLLTVADMRGTSPKVWNVWKDRLLSQLHAATTHVLRRGFGKPIDLEERISDLKKEALLALAARGVDSVLVNKHWGRLDNEYFLRHDADAIAWHAEKISATAVAELPLVAARYHPEAGGTEFLVFTPDRDDLFAVITGGFDRLNLSIMDARIHTTAFRFALDTFVALDHTGNPVTEPAQLADLEAAMRAQLLKPQPGRDLRGASLPRVLRHFPIATRTSFSNAPGGQQTMMEVVAQDRPGLLYQVALVLQECRTRLVTAKVATYGERAEDIFYITDRDGQPIAAGEGQICLESGIRERLGQPGPESSDAARGGGEAITF